MYVCISMYTYIYVYLYMYVCMHVCMYVCIYVFVNVYMFGAMNVFLCERLCLPLWSI